VSKKCPPGGVTILGRDAIERFGVRALEGVDAKMDGAIVAVVHDEFRGMGLGDLRGFLGAGAVVVDVRGMIEGKGFCYRWF